MGPEVPNKTENCLKLAGQQTQTPIKFSSLIVRLTVCRQLTAIYKQLDYLSNTTGTMGVFIDNEWLSE
jgi:hypothetical protein